MSQPSPTNLARQLLAHHFRVHPHACDTAAGMAVWWMPPALRVTESQLLPILEELFSRGVLKRKRAPDGDWMWRRAHIDDASDELLDRMMNTGAPT